MKFKKIIVVALFLLCFLMISVVSAASNTNDSTTSSVGDAVITHTEDNSGTTGEKIDFNVNLKKTEKTKTIDTSNSLKENTYSKKTSINDKNVLKDRNPQEVKDWSELNASIQNIPYGDSSSFVLIGSQKEYVVNSAIIINNSKTIIIDGNNKTLNAQNKNRIFTIDNANLIIKNLNLINGKGEDEEIYEEIYNLGGAIYAHNNSNITIINCKFTNNTANYGGAIDIEYNTTLNINNTKLSNNNANAGGAIYTIYSKLNINNTKLSNNNANAGGAIYTQNSKLNINNTTLTNNTTYGGTIAIFNSEININNTTLTQNTANTEGGAIYTENSTLNINNTKLTQNNATDGGAIYTKNSQMNINNTKLTQNTANTEGGAIYTENSTLNINNTTLTNNTATYGGAIFIYNSTININNTKLTQNNATDGGAIYTKNSQMNINNTTLTQNTAIEQYSEGGAICAYYSQINVTNTQFINNICIGTSAVGGAIRMCDSNIILTNTTFTKNNATNKGGVIANLNGLIDCYNSKFIDNYAKYGSSIHLTNAIFNIIDGLFENRNYGVTWGLIYADYGSELNIINTTFANTTSQYATAIYTQDSETYINDSQFINLFANKTAGALGFKESNKVTIENCEFINATSNKNGGAIFSDIKGIDGNGQGLILIYNTLFSNCSSGFGGAYLQLGGQLSISYSNFTGNYADFNGGAIYTSSAESMVESCIFKDNHLGIYDGYPTYGGAIFCDISLLYLKDSEFINNAAYQGSGLYTYDSEYHINDLRFTNNSNPAIYTFFDDEHSTKEDIKGITVNPTDFNNTYYPSVIIGEGMQIVLTNNTIPSEIPDHYNPRKLNLTTPVKNQGQRGACWAFGMTSTLESAILKRLNTTTDFSENNMQNTMIIYSQYGSSSVEGGLNSISIAYLLSWLGAFPQDYDSYDELGKISPIIRTDEDIHIQDIILILNTPLTKTNNDINRLNNVKEAILKYGALSADICSKSSLNEGDSIYYNPKTYAEYNPRHIDCNHEVCVVGWDDNFSKDNFLISPPGDGAWIVKNSWGTTWGDEGYFYVSYYDQTLCPHPEYISDCFVAIILENTIQYNKNYQYDFSGIGTWSYIDNDIKIYLNNFESIEDDLIAAVGTYFNKEGVDYTVEILVNDISTYNQTGISPYYGYHTIKLDKYIPIKKGDTFSVKITSNAIPICGDSRVHFKEGTSLLYNSDINVWEDLTKNDEVACIKAYTLPQLIKTENIKIITGEELFTVTVNETNANITVSINNNILTSITDENGIAKFNLSYLEDGNYTITTTYNGTSIINLVEVKNLNRLIEKLQETINKQNQKLNKTREELQKTQTQLKTLNNKINTLQKQIKTLKQQAKPKTSTKIIAKPKTFKAKTKVKKYTITLKSSKKALSKATVYLTIKGKKYKKTIKTKTNTKGKAAFKIKLRRKGKYTATITYKGDKSYKKSSKKVKITIN